MNENPYVTQDKYPVLAIQNLRDDSAAVVGLQDLEAKLRGGEQVLAPPKAADSNSYNEQLRQRVDVLLTSTSPMA